MTPQLRDLINRTWDDVDDDPTRDIRTMSDSIVAQQLGIPKWKVIAARRGYVRPARKRSDVRTVRDDSGHGSFCSTAFRYVEIRLPRISILETTHAA